jgi:VIT1/CCC1 family predicted Fe2+/Mn2+ transporter
MFGCKRGEGIQGLTYGIMDGVLTCLGVIMGLSAAGNKFFLLLAVLSVGLADALADSAAFHVAQETEKHHGKREVRKATVLTFVGVFGGFLLLGIPILFLELSGAIIVSGIMGMVILAGLGYAVARINPKFEKKHQMIEYLVMGIVVIAATYFVGRIIVGLGA